MRHAIVVALLVALSFIATASTGYGAPLGNPFLKNVASPEELAQTITEALQRDPSGTAQISPERCKRNGSCAAVVDYLEMFQVNDPKAGLTHVSQLPGYLQTLVVQKAPSGKYWTSCLKPSRKRASGWKPEFNCLARAFKPGETVWVNPKTSMLVLMSDCTNPVGAPERPDQCVYIEFYTREGDTAVRLGDFGPRPIPGGDCAPAIKRAGEDDYESPWLEECFDKHCDFRAIEAAFRTKNWRKGSYKPEPGKHVLRLPPEVAAQGSPYLVFFCIERGAATYSQSSGVMWSDYVGSPKKATIYYTQQEAEGVTNVLGKPTDLWLHR